MLALLMLFAVIGCQGAINDPLSGLTPTYAMAAPKTAGPNVSIVTTGFTDANGDFREPFSITVLPDGRVAVSVTLINTGDVAWASGTPTQFPERFVLVGGVKWNLVGLLKVDVTTNSGDLITSSMPMLYDVGDIFPLQDRTIFPSHESDSFDGFWLSPQWGYPLTENNVGAVDQPAGTIVLPSGTPAGTYRVSVTIDPNFWYGINSSWSGQFTTDGTAATLKTALKRTGRK
jgi:hypothetical protein